MKAKTLESFAKNVAAKFCDVDTDGHPSHNGFLDLFHEHIRCVQIKFSVAGEYLPWVNNLISKAKRFIQSTHHSVNHLQGYLEEFSWRFNRRFYNLFNRMIVASDNSKPAYLL